MLRRHAAERHHAAKPNGFAAFISRALPRLMAALDAPRCRPAAGRRDFPEKSVEKRALYLKNSLSPVILSQHNIFYQREGC